MDKQLVLVTGMSGAGKSSAMNALEDLGYYCIDSFPIELLDDLRDLLHKQPEKYQKLALSVSSQDYPEVANFFDNSNRSMRILFIDCSDEELLLRYRFTRRQHPLVTSKKASTVEEAIELERDTFNSYVNNQLDTIRLDTTKMTSQSLANAVRSWIAGAGNNEFMVTFQSFGFKHGIPRDADEIIDVRFLPNPYYDPDLRSLTGNDQPVYDYVMDKDETKQFLGRLKPYLDYVLEAYRSQQKKHLIISVGCTGGQHRSVSIANWLYDQYKDQYRCTKSHRDAEGSK